MPTQLTFAQRAEQSLTLKAGDRKPVLQAALRRGRVRDSAVDLSDAAEIRLYLQNDETGDLLVNQAMDVVDAENGIVEYEFGVGDTVQGGRNELEIVVTWADNRPETFPKRGYGVMQVSEPLDRELDPADLDDADISVTILRVDELRANTGQSVSVEDDLQFNGNDATGIGSLGVEELNNTLYANEFDGATGGEQIQNALDAAADIPGFNQVDVDGDGPDDHGGFEDIHLVSETIIIPEKTYLKFNGAHLRLDDGVEDDILRTMETRVDPENVDADFKKNIWIEGPVELDGNKANNNLGNEKGIRMSNVDGGRIENVVSHHNVRMGIEVRISKNIRISDCECHNNGDDGFSITDTNLGGVSETRFVRVADCSAWDNDDNGFEVDDGPCFVTFDGCQSWDNQLKCFDVHTHNDQKQPCHIHFKNCQAYADPNDSDVETSWAFAVGTPWAGPRPDEFDRNNIKFTNCTAFGSFGRAALFSSDTNNFDIIGVTLRDFEFHLVNSPGGLENAILVQHNVSSLKIEDGYLRTDNPLVNDHAISNFAPDDAVQSHIQIRNVEIEDWPNHAIRITSPASHTGEMRDISIDDCQIYGSKNSGIGIWLAENKDGVDDPTLEIVSVQNNKVFDNDNDNIRIESGWDYVVEEGNVDPEQIDP